MKDEIGVERLRGSARLAKRQAKSNFAKTHAPRAHVAHLSSFIFHLFIFVFHLFICSIRLPMLE